jgi:hypothetical protein
VAQLWYLQSGFVAGSSNQGNSGETAMAKRKYFTLLAIDGTPGCPWAVEFGSYDGTEVDAERDDYLDRGWKRKELMIVTTGDTQAEIDAVVAALNKDL